MPTETFQSDSTWTVPDGVPVVSLTLKGEKGEFYNEPDAGSSEGGDGNTVEGELSVTPGETLFVRVNNDGGGGGGQGGDSVDVRQGADTLNDRVAVAAGGGGSGGIYAGADAGYPEGGSASNEENQGGTQSSGGQGGDTYGDPGDNGSFGNGGDGNFPGGGGGGGWYGGGGGSSNINDFATGGGGGSSFIDGITNATVSTPGAAYDSGEVVIEYTPIFPPENVSVSDTRTEEVDLTWNEPSGGSPDEYNIYRATESGIDVDSTPPVATVTAGTTAYTDTALSQGVTYHYVLTTASGGNEGPASSEVTGTTLLPPVTNLQVSNVTGTGASLSWDASHTNGETLVQVREGNTGDYTTEETLSRTTEQTELTGLLNGVEYSVRVVASTEDTQTVDTA